jgi:regulator of replication initiation timing
MKRFQLSPNSKALLVSAVVDANTSNEAELLKKEQQSEVLLTVTVNAMKQNINQMALKIDELTLENTLLRKRLEEYKELYYQTSKQVFKCQ